MLTRRIHSEVTISKGDIEPGSQSGNRIHRAWLVQEPVGGKKLQSSLKIMILF